jgi:hypothetical protein
VKKIIKKGLIKIINPIATAWYVKANSINTDLVSDFDKNNLLSILFNNLKSMGFIPKHIVLGQITVPGQEKL